MIVLIPKVPGPRVMGNYRPIALANFQFKVITKILADRLATITMRIIYVEQRGFICERNIFECVILASEAINLLEKRQYEDHCESKHLLYLRNKLSWFVKQKTYFNITTSLVVPFPSHLSSR